MKYNKTLIAIILQVPNTLTLHISCRSNSMHRSSIPSVTEINSWRNRWICNHINDFSKITTLNCTFEKFQVQSCLLLLPNEQEYLNPPMPVKSQITPNTVGLRLPTLAGKNHLQG